MGGTQRFPRVNEAFALDEIDTGRGRSTPLAPYRCAQDASLDYRPEEWEQIQQIGGSRGAHSRKNPFLRNVPRSASSYLSMSPRLLANLIDAHAPALLLYARQLCAVPEDVVQESFLKLAALRDWPDDAVAWLYRVVRNAAFDAVKTQSRRAKRERVAARSVRWFVEPEIDGLDAEMAAAALGELPIEQREAIVAHLWGGLTFEQIAEVSGTAASTAFRRYRAGIASLREKLGVPCPNDPN